MHVISLFVFQDFQNYYLKNINPDVTKEKKLGKWNLNKHGVTSVTNNLSEAGNFILHQAREWKNIPVDASILLLLRYCNWQRNEIILSRYIASRIESSLLHSCSISISFRYGKGKWLLRSHLKINYDLHSNCPRLEVYTSPENIVSEVRNALRDSVKLVCLNMCYVIKSIYHFNNSLH